MATVGSIRQTPENEKHRSAEPVEARFAAQNDSRNLEAPFDRLRATVIYSVRE
jgi:hypothetical protein